jgi:glycosyltransferase involved in cell wall biosynthesis
VREKELRELADKYNLSHKVTFAGYREYPYSYMKHADLYVLSSRYEGFPNAVIEALGCGTPVLAFNCPGGIKEIIEEDINGWIVDRDNIDSMAMKIDEIFTNRMPVRSQIQKRVIKKFGIKTIVKQYEHLLLH